MNYRVSNMKFIKAAEANRLTSKYIQELMDESLESELESLAETIEETANEGVDELIYEMDEPRLAAYLVGYLTTQGYVVVHNVEDEDDAESLTISWKEPENALINSSTCGDLTISNFS